MVTPNPDLYILAPNGLDEAEKLAETLVALLEIQKATVSPPRIRRAAWA